MKTRMLMTNRVSRPNASRRRRYAMVVRPPALGAGALRGPQVVAVGGAADDLPIDVVLHDEIVRVFPEEDLGRDVVHGLVQLLVVVRDLGRVEDRLAFVELSVDF